MNPAFILVEIIKPIMFFTKSPKMTDLKNGSKSIGFKSHQSTVALLKHTQQKKNTDYTVTSNSKYDNNC